MRKDVAAVWNPMQQQLFDNQKNLEKEALSLLKTDPDKLKAFLTNYAIKWGNTVVNRAWKLGDDLWTKYDEKF